MKEHRDSELGDLLRQADEAPPLGPDFDGRLWMKIESETRARPQGLRLPRLSPGPWARHPVLASAVAVAIVAGVAVAVLVGLPRVSRISGPQPASAAQVIHKMLLALSSGKTLQADSTDRFLVGGTGTPGGPNEYLVSHNRLLWRSDGSFRFTQTDMPQTSRPPWRRDRMDAADTAYDASHGVLRHYLRGWDPEAGAKAPWEPGAGAYVNRVEVTTGYPLGPPDAWPSLQGWDFSATARALQVAGAATLETTTYLGRPVWVISGSTRAAVGTRFTRDEIALFTVDQQTCLPLRFQLLEDGVLAFEYDWRNVRVDEPLPDTAFTFAPPKGAKVVRKDAGFRRLSLARMASKTGYVAVLPAWLPAGYVQKWTAAATRSTTANGVIKGRDVVAVQYVRGFDALTVTTRAVADPVMAAEFDPIEEGATWYPILRKDVRLAGGSFAGATASIVMGPHITVPHLWAVKDGLMLTVAGSATARELIAIAESLLPYRVD